MPIFDRTLCGFRPGNEMSSPSKNISPSSIGSSRFIHLSNVDFPAPEAPIKQTICP